jgi:hypothetical protein
MAGGPTVHHRRVLVPALTSLLLGLLALSGVAEPSVATVAIADSGRTDCLARCVEPSGIRWEEAAVDSTALLGS